MVLSTVVPAGTLPLLPTCQLNNKKVTRKTKSYMQTMKRTKRLDEIILLTAYHNLWTQDT